MQERTRIVTLKGKSITLIGNELRVGDKAPDFIAVDNDLNPVKFSSFKGKIIVISSVPSLDTPICDAQTRRFNREASRMSSNVMVLNISMDLPFAQKRWCGASGLKDVRTLSDHKEAEFGTSYGLLMKELRLLARAVLVIDTDGIIRYIQIVPEIAQEPNYEEVLSFVEEMLEVENV